MSLIQWAEAVGGRGVTEADARTGWMASAIASVLSRGQGGEDLVGRFRGATTAASFGSLLRALGEGRLGWIESRLGPRLMRDEVPPPPGKIVVLGDVHRKWVPVQRILDHEFPEGNGTALAVGDLVSYPLLAGGHRLFFITGNHENFRFVRGLPSAVSANGLPGYFVIHPGDVITLGALRVAGLGGVHSPYFYEKPPGEVPPRFFSSDAVRRTGRLRFPIDLFLMHEAPFRVGFRKGGADLGKPVLTDLIRLLQPRVAFFGHHHLDFDGTDGATDIVGLNYPHRSYVVVERDPATDTLSLRRVEATLIRGEGGREGRYQFAWERGMEEGAAVLYGGVVAMNREERVLRVLQEKYRVAVQETLTLALLREVTGANEAERASQAETRAGLAVQTVLPHVARYISDIESKPEVDRARLLSEIHEGMTKDVAPFVIPDLQKAFQYFLQAWGLVAS